MCPRSSSPATPARSSSRYSTCAFCAASSARSGLTPAPTTLVSTTRVLPARVGLMPALSPLSVLPHNIMPKPRARVGLMPALSASDSASHTTSMLTRSRIDWILLLLFKKLVLLMRLPKPSYIVMHDVCALMRHTLIRWVGLTNMHFK